MQKRLYAASVDARRRGPAVRAWHLAVLALGVVVAVLHSLRSTRSTPLGGLRAKRAPASAADYAIPALIWQTWFTSDLFPAAAARVAQTKRLNPGHAHRLVNDTEAAAFMRRHFAGRVANAYFAINPVLGAARADLWRYCVLYKFGGFYLDLDVKCDRPLRALHSPGAKLVHTHEHTPLPAKPPKALDCIAAAVRPGRASQLFSPRRVAALGLPQTTVAQYFLGAAPKDPVLKLVIDDVVRSIEALDEGRCGTPKTFSARDRQKHHTWTWLRTIWLTGPFALTVAFHNYTHAHGRSPAVVALDFKQGVLHGACETDKVLNAAMDRAHVRYARLDDKVGFLADKKRRR